MRRTQEERFCWSGRKHHSLSDTDYTVTIGDFILEAADGTREAGIFYYSYAKFPEDSNRPVIFAYNGGPGASSEWLHLGLLGPKIFDFGEYPDVEDSSGFALKENPWFLIDVCDIVLLDPPGTSYTVDTNSASEKKYYSTKGDAEAFKKFITNWIEENGRKKSPIYLLGESYGTIRNVVLADLLEKEIEISGIISIGTSINVGAKSPMYVEPNVRRIGANAAACWYHKHRDECSLNDFVHRAMSFGYGEYAKALLLGSRYPNDEYAEVQKKLSYYTGVPEEFLGNNDLRFSEDDFKKMLCPGSIVSTSDSRLVANLDRPIVYASVKAPGNVDIPDDSLERFQTLVGNVFSSGIVDYVDGELDHPGGWKYKDNVFDISMKWNFDGYEKDTMTLPQELMKRDSDIRFMFINGFFDLSSTFDFVTYYLSRYKLPEDRVIVKVYNSGHASYIGKNCAEEMSRDISAFIKQSL